MRSCGAPYAAAFEHTLLPTDALTRSRWSAKPPLGAFLEKHRLAFEDRQRFLEARYLCLATFRPLLVAHRLRDTSVRELGKIFEHCIKFSLHVGSVRCGLRNLLVEFRGLLRFVLDILLHGCLEDLVLLGLPVILGGRGLLAGNDVCQ